MGGIANAATELRVGAASNIGGMIVFVAQDKGFFAKNGIDAKVVVRSTGSALTKSLNAGEIDFAPAAFTNLPVALEKGLKLRGVVGYLGSSFTKPTHDSNVGIVTRSDSGIKSAADLKGKKVGVTFGSTVDLYMREYLKKNGISIKDVNRVNVRPPSLVSILDSGGVDAIVAWEPNLTLALDKVKGSKLLSRGGDYICFCAVMHGIPDKVYKDRKRTQAFVDAMSEAAQYLRNPKNADDVAKIGSRYVKAMTPDLVKRTVKHVVYDARIGGGTTAAFNFSVKQLIASKKMEKPFDPAKYLDTSFVENTMKRHPEWFSDLK
ncbi:MAG: ABC transporter substrate-binding protein [Proteobacteria bacterium]|nr:ABC transporter substrate-binding protein [Pseudomonadota bacterium]